MKENYAKLIDDCNSKRANIYYKLNQLTDITGLCPRTLKYRIKKIKKKYVNVPSLLRKEGKYWQIHVSIVNEFLPLRRRETRTINTFEWKTFATWAMKNSYDSAYHLELIKQVKSEINPCFLNFTIEETKHNVKHVHFISDANKLDLNNAINKVLDKYLDKKDYKLEVTNLNNRYSAINYIGKSPIECGVI